MSSNPINLIVTVTIKEESTDAFLEAIKIDCIGSRGEPGCLAFDVMKGEAGTFHFYESYKDQAALDFHKATEHFAAWTAFKETGNVTSVAVVRAESLF